MFLAKLTKNWKGLRFRLTVVYSTLFGLFLILFGVVSSNQYMETTENFFDSTLLSFALDLSGQVKFENTHLQTKLNIPEIDLKKRFPFVLGETYYSLRDLDGKILIANEALKPLSIPYRKDLADQAIYTHRFLSFRSNKTIYRAVNLKLINADKENFILQVATPSHLLQEQRDQHFLINLITIPLLIIIASIISYLIAGKTLTPIKSLSSIANNIAAQNLSLRVPTFNTGDEIEELACTLNNLLERLEKAFKGQEHFVANASHQLNTPLAIIKGELDVLETKERSLDDINKFHKSLREELERLIELVKNMLLISRVESGQENFIMRPVRIDDVLMGIVARLGPKARDKKIQIKFNITETRDDLSFEVQGERQLLDCLFENIIENAIKYSPIESVIELRISLDQFKKVISIQDEGPGIEAEDLKQILSSRFKRGDKVLIPGSGIGLSIAFQIAQYHNAKIGYQKLDPYGSLFSVTFPN